MKPSKKAFKELLLHHFSDKILVLWVAFSVNMKHYLFCSVRYQTLISEMKVFIHNPEDSKYFIEYCCHHWLLSNTSANKLLLTIGSMLRAFLTQHKYQRCPHIDPVNIFAEQISDWFLYEKKMKVQFKK